MAATRSSHALRLNSLTPLISLRRSMNWCGISREKAWSLASVVPENSTREESRSLYADRWAASASSARPGRWLELDPEPRLSRTMDLFHSPRMSVLLEGLLYNRTELIDELRLAPSATPAATIAAAYDRWQLDFVRHVRGIFALVLRDSVIERTVAVRDALGSVPLFYVSLGGRLVLATSAETLRRRPGVSRGFNRAALADHLCHRWPDQQETFFEGVKRVPPGYILLEERGTTRVTRYWDPVPEGGPMEWIPEAETQSRFDDAFERAVSRTLDFGPTGIFLSGGLDSISVAAMAADVARRRRLPLPLALSLGFEGDIDEAREQRGVAAKLGLSQEFVPFNEAAPSSGLLASALELTQLQAAPLLNTWMPAYTNLARRAKSHGISVITSGAGGDEWLAVSPLLAADLIRAGDIGGMLQLYRGWRRSYAMSPLRTARSLFWRFGIRPLAAAVGGSVAPRAWRRSRVVRGVRGTKPWVAVDQTLRQELRDRIERTLVTGTPSQGFYLRDVRATLEHPLTVLEMEEIYEMGRRLDIRFLHPFWDAEVVDILYRTPPLRLFAEGRSKSVVRQTMARRFPELGLEHQKKRAGTTFYARVLDREIPALWSQRPGFDELADLGIIDPVAARAMGTSSVEKKSGLGLVSIWDLMNVNTWVRAHQ